MLSLFCSRRPAACVAKRAGNLSRTVALSLPYRKAILQVKPLLSVHAELRAKRAEAEHGNAERDKGDPSIDSGRLEAIVMENQVVDHFQWHDKGAQRKGHDERPQGDLGIHAVALDLLLLFFAECPHGCLSYAVGISLAPIGREGDCRKVTAGPGSSRSIAYS